MLRRTFYWTFTALTVLWLFAGGLFDSLHKSGAVEILRTLGYPAYLCSILGAAKLLAVCALLYPRTRLLREWAYAGVTFNMVGAFWSHLVVHDTVPATIAPVLLLALTAGSYWLRPAAYRLHARVEDPVMP